MVRCFALYRRAQRSPERAKHNRAETVQNGIVRQPDSVPNGNAWTVTTHTYIYPNRCLDGFFGLQCTEIGVTAGHGEARAGTIEQMDIRGSTDDQ